MPWLGWSEEAFRRSRELDRCIVLAVQSAGSRWSPRLEKDSLADPDVVKLLEDYVPVRVDADLRPDVADRYAPGAVPAVAFLDPAGRLLYATGFLDAGELRPLLVQLKAGYASTRGALDAEIRRRDELVAQVLRGRYPGKGIAPGELRKRTLAGVLEVHDAANGGFGAGSKTPNVASLRVLLAAEGDAAAREALERTLGALAAKPVRDAVDGGWYSGTFDPRWSEPSWEKPLEGTAELAALFLEAGERRGVAAWTEAGRDALRWLFGRMWDEERGVFLGAEHSDENYYRRPAGSRGAPPELDRRVFADRSARAVSCGFAASRALGDRSYAEKSLRALHGLLETHREADGSVRHAEGGATGLLRDASALGHALLDATEFTSDPRYRAEAERIAERIVPGWYSAEERGLLDRRPGVDELGELSRKLTHPSQSGEALRLLARVGAEPLRQDARAVFAGLPDFTPDYGCYTAELALAAAELES